MSLVPRNDWVLIEPQEREEITKGGIVLPEIARMNDDGLREGTVISVGPGMLSDGELMEVDKELIGKIVAYSKFTGSEIEHEDKRYHILREFDIIAVVE